MSGTTSRSKHTVLITGANGLVGSNLYRLLHRDFHLLGLVRQPVASLGPLDEGSPESDPASDQQLAASPESDPASGQRNPPAGNPEPHAAENPPGLPPEALFAAATYRLMPIFRDLMNHLTELRYSLYSIDPVFGDLEELRDLVREGPDKDLNPLPFEHEITIKDLRYAYPNSSDQALYNISLTIPRGKAVALVGESGAGKTTLVDALLGLLELQGGSIRVDGTDVLENPRAWRRNIGYIPQFIYLMDDTLMRNVAMGLEDGEIDMDRFKRAVEAAQLSELIDHLPDGEHTVLGERGVRLSGGQRQRVGIARALYHNPQLLIMDEGTSALDNITERYIIEAIDRLKGDRSVILIAHRLSTVMNCDAIYLMEGGRITDHGTYAELLHRNARFRAMAGNVRDDKNTRG